MTPLTFSGTTAIETTYRGYRMRSRLEARWAVVFTDLGIDWVYEPEGYLLPSLGAYLPDFRLSLSGGTSVFVEVKPGYASEAEKERCVELARLTDMSVILIMGQPWPTEYQVHVYRPNNVVLDGLHFVDPRCGCDGSLFLLSADGWIGWCGCGCDRAPSAEPVTLLASFEAARSCRFGERPAVQVPSAEPTEKPTEKPREKWATINAALREGRRQANGRAILEILAGIQ